MYSTAKSYSCSICGSNLKNSASLKTHKYRYHPNSSKKKLSITPTLKENTEFDKMSSISNSSTHEFNHDRDMSWDNQMHESDIENLQSDVRELKSLINKLATKVRLQEVVLDGVERDFKRQRMNPDTTRSFKPEEVSLMKDQTRSNARRIRVIEEQLTSKNGQVEAVDNEEVSLMKHQTIDT